MCSSSVFERDDCAADSERHYFVSLLVKKKGITLSELDIFFFLPKSSLYITYVFNASAGCRDSGSVGFLIPPSVLHLFDALSEGQHQIHPNETPLLIHLVPPYSFSPRKHRSFFVLPGLMRLSGHTCTLRNIPLLSLKLYYSAQGRDSQCF